MKLGKKSHLISAYTALFTVAFGVLVWDYMRRSSAPDEQPVAKAKPASVQAAFVSR